MKKLSAVLAILSWVIFVVSFLLPAVRIDVESVLGWRIELHETIRGWKAAWATLASLGDVFADPTQLIPVLHGATNFLILLSPAAVLSRRPGRCRWLAYALLLATLFNASLAWRLEGAAWVGFYMWLVSFGLTAAGVYLAGSRSVGNPTMSSNHPLKATVGGGLAAD